MLNIVKIKCLLKEFLANQSAAVTVDFVVSLIDGSYHEVDSNELAFQLAAKNALKEEAFVNGTANYIVYGHSHRYEVVPLDLVSDGSGHNKPILVTNSLELLSMGPLIHHE